MENMLMESEVQQEQDIAVMQAQLNQDKIDSEVQLKELEAKFEARLEKLFAHLDQKPAPSTGTVSEPSSTETSHTPLLFRR